MRKNKSVREKFKGLTFASASKKISDKYKNRETSSIEQKSYLAEMEQLMALQESLKTIAANKRPFKASKFDFGGWLSALNGIASTVPTTVPSLPTIPTVANGVQAPIRPLPVASMSISDAEPFAPAVTDNAMYTQPDRRSNIYTPVTVGKAVEGAGKLAMLASGYDKVAPQYNPFESDIRRTMNRGINMDTVRQQVLGNQNNALNATSNIRSEAVRQAINNRTFANTSDALANVSLQEQQTNNQYKADMASTLNNLGQQRTQANILQDQLNQASKSNWQIGLSNALTDAYNTGKELTNLRATNRQQALLGEVLKTRNFEFNNVEDLMKRMSTGEDIKLADIIKIIQPQGGSIEDAGKIFAEFKTRFLK